MQRQIHYICQQTACWQVGNQVISLVQNLARLRGLSTALLSPDLELSSLLWLQLDDDEEDMAMKLPPIKYLQAIQDTKNCSRVRENVYYIFLIDYVSYNLFVCVFIYICLLQRDIYWYGSDYDISYGVNHMTPMPQPFLRKEYLKRET